MYLIQFLPKTMDCPRFDLSTNNTRMSIWEHTTGGRPFLSQYYVINVIFSQICAIQWKLVG